MQLVLLFECYKVLYVCCSVVEHVFRSSWNSKFCLENVVKDINISVIIMGFWITSYYYLRLSLAE